MGPAGWLKNGQTGAGASAPLNVSSTSQRKDGATSTATSPPEYLTILAPAAGFRSKAVPRHHHRQHRPLSTEVIETGRSDHCPVVGVFVLARAPIQPSEQIDVAPASVRGRDSAAPLRIADVRGAPRIECAALSIG
jgi:hypothetical protein